MEYPKQRNLDGIYFRVKRNERFCNVCFSDLTYEEREKVMDGSSREWLENMCDILARTIRNIGDQLDLTCER